MVTTSQPRSTVGVITRLLLAGFLTLVSGTSASGELTVSIDRNQVYLNETFELRVNGEVDFKFDFGSLLNFNSLDIPEPDLTELSKNFDIVNRQQQYNIRSVNGKNTAQITWVYELMPKTEGTTVIPALSFKNQVSKPVPITVLPASKKQNNSGEPPLVFVETELDKNEAWIQEQIILTVRLYHLNARPSGDLESPELPDAIVEKLGEGVNTYRMRYNRRYDVIERKYVIFPQKSGKLEIPALSFKGRVVDQRKRKRRYTTQRSEPASVTIKPIPTQFTGSTWLPALAIELTENFSAPIDQIKQGDSVTRTLHLTAVGLLGSAIPDLDIGQPQGLKAYPEPPERESTRHSSGVQSTYTESVALVAVNPGEAWLPEIRIPWWDTVNNVQREAIIPARKLIVAPAGITAQTPSPDQAGYRSPDNSFPATETTGETASNHETGANTPTTSGIWKLIGLSTTALWIVTLGVLVYLIKNGSPIRATRQPGPIQHPVYSKKEMIKAVRQKRPNALQQIVAWAQGTLPNSSIDSIQDVIQHYSSNEELAEAIRQYEKALFSKESDRAIPDQVTETLIRQLKSLDAHSHSNRPNPDDLTNLYPA
ncbi:MAG: hypothetical protein CSB48_02005 [Proteobacteria bacterium]|nr:MAG: hypothetical protein CSB48_02005 [Pseudomonadota bacterium]PIE40365.1 MAG: hypothetical protein CSA51_01075 [Gammaproteobacteria bacterium]